MSNSVSALISGIVLIVIGVVLLILGVFKVGEFGGLIVISIYGVIALCVGIAILVLRKREDEIEQIKKRKE